MLFLSAGEVSGDTYAADLLAQLQCQLHAPCFGLGGPALQAAGQIQLANVLAYSAVGLTENLHHLRYFKALLARCKAWLRQCRPQAVILVDFQGFNLQLGRYARELGIPVFYYIAPQAWIWRAPGDLRRIARSCDLILSVFLREHVFYQQQGLNSHFVGHPLLQRLAPFTPETPSNTTHQNRIAPTLCWLAGSRTLEIQRLAPILRTLIGHSQNHPALRHYHHVLPVATPALGRTLKPWFKDLSVDFISAADRYSAMANSQAVIGASGSAILEAVLLKKPTIALYQVSSLTYAVAKHLVKTPWITLPNLLLQRPLVPEFIQHLEAADILQALHHLSAAPFVAAHPELVAQLGASEGSILAAQTIMTYLRKRESSC